MEPTDTGASRPTVTLAYAQSLDGSIAAQPGQPLALSGPESLRLTHELRARHDAILVGIGAVLADDPRLTVRLVEGRDPRPVILDSLLRCPTRARFLQASSTRPIIATTALAPQDRALALEAAGAFILRLPHTISQTGLPLVSLPALLACLRGEGIASLMVEGGAGVITSFLAARLVDWVVLTIAPVFTGGVRAVSQPVFATPRCMPRLQHATSEWRGGDLIVQGSIDWSPGDPVQFASSDANLSSPVQFASSDANLSSPVQAASSDANLSPMVQSASEDADLSSSVQAASSDADRSSTAHP